MAVNKERVAEIFEMIADEKRRWALRYSVVSVLSKIPEFQTPDWVKRCDQTPPEETSIYFFVDGFGVILGRYDRSCSHRYVFTNDSGKIDGFTESAVTHWMLVPKREFPPAPPVLSTDQPKSDQPDTVKITAPSTSQWVVCSDRAPEINQSVYIVVRGKVRVGCTWLGDRFMIVETAMEIPRFTVSHWMPHEIPAPPIEEDSELVKEIKANNFIHFNDPDIRRICQSMLDKIIQIIKHHEGNRKL